MPKMAKRDPNKTARNKIIATLTNKLEDLLPKVLDETDFKHEQSLNATLGSKHDEFFDLRTDVIHSQQQFISQWLRGLKDAAHTSPGGASARLWRDFKKQKNFQEYTLLFLERSYLKHFDELSKNRPAVEAAEIWIGQERANYGLLVTPRFKNQRWENDKSEIRSFKQPYWTIGHVMATGLVIPGEKEPLKFHDIDQYLLSFRKTLVRQAGSKYQDEIATLYCDYVKASDDPEVVPLLIPEFRYAGLEKKHIYRLDFLVINPYSLDKVGFELSPWSSHGYLAKTGQLTQKEINRIAADKFAHEVKRHRLFFKEHAIVCLIFTDDSLADTETLFEEEIRPRLEPEKPKIQLFFPLLQEFLYD